MTTLQTTASFLPARARDFVGAWSGALQNVIKWLVQIQQPELFQAITSFSLKSANEPPTVTLELEVARWYAPNP
jgi:hypothetical protein